MDKLIERETATRNPLIAAPALAVQFFLIPLTVVGVTVLLYMGFRSLVADPRTAQDYLNEIRYGGADRQWPAAYELSRLMEQKEVRADRSLAPALVKAFEEAKNEDPRVRRYLALAIGRLDPPLPPEAVAALVESLEDPERHWNPDWFSRLNGWSDIDINEARISTIWALGSSGDPSVVAKLAAALQLRRCRDSQDCGLCSRCTAWRLADRHVADGPRGFGDRREVECSGRPRAARPSGWDAGAAPDDRSGVCRAGREAGRSSRFGPGPDS